MNHWLLLLIGLFLNGSLHAEPLPASEVFQLQASIHNPNTITLRWEIKSGYFLYSERIKLSPQPESNIELGAVRLPPTETKIDKQGHEYAIYRNQLTLPVDVLGLNAGESLVQLRYQGCSDDGFCYPPEIKELKIGIDNQLGLSSVSIEKISTPAKETPSQDAPAPLSQVFEQHHWPMILLIFYGFGLLLSFTPCILPMVPVLSGIIVGHGEAVTTRKAFFLSLSYVLSMSVTYSAVGAVVALLGENLQVSMQSPWAISLFSLIFVVLAFSMFGFYELKLPTAWQSKIAGSGSSPRGGHYLGAALMGCLSTLILSPCVTAPLIGVLTYIAQSHDVLLGSLTLFVLSLGMGTPLLLIGISAGKLVPKTGGWMNSVKAFFGILLLGVAIYLLERIAPTSLTMLLWACLCIFSGIYAGALLPAYTPTERGRQGVGIILFVYGLLILIGTSSGANNPLQPLSSFKSNGFAAPRLEQANTKQTLAQIKQEIGEAQGIPVLLDFYADWCTSCKEMEATTFQNPQITALLSQYRWIKVDVTENNAENKKIMHYFKVVAPPTFIFFNRDGKELTQLTTVGEISTAQFAGLLEHTLKLN